MHSLPPEYIGHMPHAQITASPSTPWPLRLGRARFATRSTSRLCVSRCAPFARWRVHSTLSSIGAILLSAERSRASAGNRRAVLLSVSPKRRRLSLPVERALPRQDSRLPQRATLVHSTRPKGCFAGSLASTHSDARPSGRSPTPGRFNCQSDCQARTHQHTVTSATRTAHSRERSPPRQAPLLLVLRFECSSFPNSAGVKRMALQRRLIRPL